MGRGQASETTLPFHSHSIPSSIPFPSPVQVCWAAHDDLFSARPGRETHFVPAWESRARFSGSLNKQFDRTTRLCRGVRRTTQHRARTPPLAFVVLWRRGAHRAVRASAACPLCHKWRRATATASTAPAPHAPSAHGRGRASTQGPTANGRTNPVIPASPPPAPCPTPLPRVLP